jgi:hypothetical protein
MKQHIAIVLSLTLFMAGSNLALAGNKDRTGQAGATELMINPWARTTGLFGMNTSYVSGVEAMKSNIAGLALVGNNDIGLSNTSYLLNNSITINNLGLAQKIGSAGVVGFNIMSNGFGEIEVTDVDHPKGGIGTYKPSFINMTLGYARTFNKNIHAGVAATLVSEQINNARATGATFDAGVQYVSGARDNFHFGVTLRNVGTNMTFRGSGFSLLTSSPDGDGYSITVQTPSARFEMPTYLNFGASYDFFLDEHRLPSADAKPKHRLTGMLNFTSNSFNNDYLGGGAEYAYKEMLMLRAALRYEKDIFNAEASSTFYSGFAFGATVQRQLGKTGPMLAIDYSFRPTVRPNDGVHCISLRFSGRPKKAAAANDGSTKEADEVK